MPKEYKRLRKLRKKRSSILWRTLFFKRPKCHACDRDSWGHLCCWDCGHLEDCLPRWYLLYNRNIDVGIYCPYAKSRKSCSTLLHLFEAYGYDFNLEI